MSEGITAAEFGERLSAAVAAMNEASAEIGERFGRALARLSREFARHQRGRRIVVTMDDGVTREVWRR